MNNIRYLFVGGVLLHLLSLLLDYDTGYQLAVVPELIGAGVAAGGSLLNTGLNALFNGTNKSNARYSQELQKDLMDYQWSKYGSPKAQAQAYAEAGFNPAVAFGQGGLSAAQPSVKAPEVASTGNVVTPMDITNDILALAQAKKAGVETKNLEIEAQAKQFDLDLQKVYGSDEKYVGLLNAWKLARSSDDQHDIAEWTKKKEEALAGLSGAQKDTAEKILANMDYQIKQENEQRSENIALTKEKQKTEGTMQQANKASARASNAQADLSQSQKKYQDIVNDIKDSGKSFELENIINKWKSENKINNYQYEQAKFWLRRMSKLNKQLEGDDLKSKISRELDDFFWYWKDEVPSIDMPSFMIPLK